MGGVLAGCGGSGGETPVASLATTVDFTRAGTSGGRSVRLRLFDLAGADIGGQVIDATGDGIRSLNLRTTKAGDIRVSAELYASPGASGDILGSVDTIIASSSRPTLRLSVGEAASSVRVTPQAATLALGGGRPYYAAGVGGSGALVFTDPTGFVFEALGGNATSTPNGVVTATGIGSSTIRATYTPTGATGAATLSVVPRETTRSKWTVLVYLNAANDLAPFSEANVNQMERVAGNKDVRFIVQWKLAPRLGFGSGSGAGTLFDGTRRYLVKPDTDDSRIASEVVQDMGSGVDMGAPGTLSDFIAWGKANYPSDRLAVVVWNHGNGWLPSLYSGQTPRTAQPKGVSYDDDSLNSIETWELGQAVANGTGGDPVDILSWDSSLMQMLEVAYEVKDAAKYIVGSEESPPGAGLPYDRVFGVFRDNPNASTAQLSKAFVDGMLAVPAYRNEKITQSVLDTSKLPALISAVDSLAAALIANKADVDPILPGVRSASQRYSDDSRRRYRDLVDVCTRIESATPNAAVDAASANVRAAVAAATVWEGHNDNSPGSRGIAIDFSAGGTFMDSVFDYRKMRFGKDTRWDEFLLQAP